MLYIISTQDIMNLHLKVYNVEMIEVVQNAYFVFMRNELNLFFKKSEKSRV